MTTPDADTYALKSADLTQVAAPVLPYQPPAPRFYRPRIALVGAGGIASAHLDAYRTGGWEVAAICSRNLSNAQALAAVYAPAARITDSFDTILTDPSIDVIDLTPHPADRLPLIEAALRASKHVLSQKPFVLDLAQGQRLVTLARDHGVKLAVNQNGRWAPHLSYMRHAVQAGLVGEVQAVQVAINWNHGWIAGTPFERTQDLILYDFGIHWFDFLTSVFGPAESVYAMAAKAHGQSAAVPLIAQVLVRKPGALASLIFDGAAQFGPSDTTHVSGTKGALRSEGPDLGRQSVALTTASGQARPDLQGIWFNEGFRGAMGALLVAIEDDTEPENGAAGNLDSLALAFAAIHSRQTGREVAVGSATRIDL